MRNSETISQSVKELSRNLEQIFIGKMIGMKCILMQLWPLPDLAVRYLYAVFTALPKACRCGLHLLTCRYTCGRILQKRLCRREIMSSSEDDTIACYIYLRWRKKRKKHWRHPYIAKNINSRLFVAACQLQQDDAKFQAMYKMSKQTYHELLCLIAPRITKENTRFRECVSAEERLLITLRYLATGSTFTALALYFARGDSTISDIIAETTEVIWMTLQTEYLAIPSTEKWEDISNRFYELWNIPNCLGAMDGKHIRIQKLPNSGSTNYNYKGYHSIVLLAVCDADGLFSMIDTGYAGRNSDGGVFQASALSYWLERDGLNIPASSSLPHDDTQQEVPYFFVADNAFPLKRNIMRPYPMAGIDNIKRIYNYRHSRARKTIECAFGMMTQKFQVLLTPIRCLNYSTVNNIVKSVCVLHNFIRLRDGVPYSATESGSTQDRLFNFERHVIHVNPRSSGAIVRKYLTNYFVLPRASLPWQYNHCV